MPNLYGQSLVRLLILNAIEAINNRPTQLEDIETRLYLGKDVNIQRRVREDEQLQRKRQKKDRDFHETLRERDEEKDVVRTALSHPKVSG